VLGATGKLGQTACFCRAYAFSSLQLYLDLTFVASALPKRYGSFDVTDIDFLDTSTVSVSPILQIRFTPTHDFREWQVIFVVEFGVFVQAEIRETFAFLVSPSNIETHD
jgi:hypothetical protein